MAGVRGKRGEKGLKGNDGAQGATGVKGESYKVVTRTHSSFLISPLFSKRKSFSSPNPFDHLYVRDSEGKLHSPSRNHDVNSDDPVIVSTRCPPGTRVISGNCKWSAQMLSTAKDSWCRSKDFKEARKRGCKDCIISKTTASRTFENVQTLVVIGLTLADQEGRETSFEMDGRSCSILDNLELDKKGLKDCGYFCFFHQFDAFHHDDTTFSCKYIPPASFGPSSLLRTLVR